MEFHSRIFLDLSSGEQYDNQQYQPCKQLENPEGVMLVVERTDANPSTSEMSHLISSLSELVEIARKAWSFDRLTLRIASSFLREVLLFQSGG